VNVPPFTQFTYPKPPDKRPDVPDKLLPWAVGVVLKVAAAPMTPKPEPMLGIE
jgi:hypothetical protein